jgi:hypothetical protein
MRIKNLLAATFISPEVVIVLAVMFFLQVMPAEAIALGKAIRSDVEVWKYLPTLTLAFSIAAINFSSKLRAPLENSSNKPLYQWPLYDFLVDRVYVGIFFSVLAGAASLSLWILGSYLSESTVAAIFLVSTLASGATALTMMLAQQKLRELIDKHS